MNSGGVGFGNRWHNNLPMLHCSITITIPRAASQCQRAKAILCSAARQLSRNGKGARRCLRGARRFKPIGHERIDLGMKSQADVGGRNLKINVAIPGYTEGPVHDAISAGIDGGLQNGRRQITPQDVDKVAPAMTGIAVFENICCVLAVNPPADGTRGQKYRSMGCGPTKR